MNNESRPKKKGTVPIITQTPSRLPGRRKRASRGFGEDEAGSTLTRRVQREMDNPTVTSEV